MIKDVSEEGPRVQPDEIKYVDLWKYFENRGSALKGTMLQILTLLIGFATAILTYALDKTLRLDASPVVTNPNLLFVLASVGTAIVLYAEIVIREFGEHINRNFDRADYSRIGDRPLDEILEYSECTDRLNQKLPELCITVRWITWPLGFIFLLGLVLSWLQR